MQKSGTVVSLLFFNELVWHKPEKPKSTTIHNFLKSVTLSTLRNSSKHASYCELLPVTYLSYTGEYFQDL